ncbi:MAG: ROK family protein [Desulfobacterota bacterium]|nr:ROK family protein [Thermodesulfobacteriota bacterium]MDW8002417.1 ROK family protein [Deltaproteobacteria bacterium]
MVHGGVRIGIDIGGTKTSFGFFDEAGKLVFFEKIGTEKDYEYLKDKMLSSIVRVVSEKGIKIKDIKKIGIACAGQIDTEKGIVKFSPNLGWRDIPLKTDFESFFSVETYVENDANAATYGEWRFSFSGKPKNVVGIFIGTGVGGGIIIDGRLYRGSKSLAGEIGHMILNPDKYPCNCGSRGCFEAICGGDYILQRVRRILDGSPKGKIWEMIRNGKLYVSYVEEGYYLGDEILKNIWEEVIVYLGFALVNIANIFNPELIILGGGVIDGTKRLVSEAKRVFEEKAMFESKRHLSIEISKLGDRAGILGAAFIDGTIG